MPGWRAKVLLKLVLSRIPLSHGQWKKLGIFRHGPMEDPEYAYEVFMKHFERSPFGRKGSGFVAVELGPGDSLFSAMIAAALGAQCVYLIDIGPFASTAPDIYRSMASYLQSRGLSPPFRPGPARDVDQVLRLCRARYLTAGLNSLQAIPDHSVDFVWSHTVLQHIRRREFSTYCSEMRRILRPDGIASHRMDLTDMLAGGLNNLRFPTRIWEADWVASSGFYTNRMRFSEMLRAFRDAGFENEIVGVNSWEVSPIRRSQLADEFKRLDSRDLLVNGFDVLLRPAGIPRQ